MPFIETSNHRLLFIHIPKTGGSSIEEAMHVIGPLRMRTKAIPVSLRVPPEHFRYADYVALLGRDFFSYAFAVVRNPYDRLESEYRMRSILASQGLWGTLPEFSVWLEGVLESTRRDRSYLANHFRPQVEFLSSNVRVFKYEATLGTALSQVGNETGVYLELPQKRYLSSKEFRGRIHWHGHDVQAVNEFYRADFEVLGYKFKQLGIVVTDAS